MQKNYYSILSLYLLTAMGGAYAQVQDTTSNFNYDNMGNVTSVTRPLSHTSIYSYDELGRVTKKTTTTGARVTDVSQAYDGLDHTTSITDPLGHITSYTINGLNNWIALNSPDTRASSYTVDEAGQVTSATDARGKNTTYQYDVLSRLTLAQFQFGVPSQFEYDGGPGGPPSEVGNLTRIIDESGFTVFTHDLKGRVLSKIQTVTAGQASGELIVRYRYGVSGTALSKLESIIYPSGAQVNYHYSDNGQISSVTLNLPTSPNEIPLLTNIAYNPTGSIQSWNWGTTALPAYQRTYDLDGRLTSYPIDMLGTVRTVNYNSINLITAYTHAGGPNPSQYNQSFTYDDGDRLASFTLGNITTGLSYDANGNRTQQTGPNVSYSYDTTSNRLSSATFALPRSYAYDTAGNRTSDGIYTYTYSDRGRLAQVGGNAQLNMFYNALGQRVLKAGVSGSTTYVYDEGGRSIGEYCQGSICTTETVYLGDLPIAAITPQGYYYVLVDQVAAPLVLAQPDGTTVWDWRNRDPFGNNAPLVSSVSPKYNLRFPGQVADPETGLFYNYFRDYDPQTGRYIESDVIGLKGGINTYTYVGANPLSYSDALGLLVTAVLDRNARTLTVTDNDTGRSITATAFTGGHTNSSSGLNIREIAAPDGDYYITPNVNEKTGHEEWFSLLQAKLRIDDTFEDHGFQRSGARLHLGGQSFGCVTVDKNTPGNAANWKTIRDLIMSTKTGMINYHPSYNSFEWRTINLPSYGILTIK